MKVILYHISHSRGQGTGALFHGEGNPHGQENMLEGAVRYRLFFGGFICVNQFFSYTLCHYYCCCYCLVSYLIAVSSKTLFQPMILPFVAPILNFILPQWEAGGENREAHGTWFGESQWGH